KNPSPRNRSARDRSSERQDLVDELRMGEDHASAAVPLEAELVKDLPWFFPSARPLDERREGAADDLATRETADRDDHSLTGTTSAVSFAPRARAASSVACGACPGRSTSGRTLGIASRDRCRSNTGRGLARSPCGPRPLVPSRRRLARSR